MQVKNIIKTVYNDPNEGTEITVGGLAMSDAAGLGSCFENDWGVTPMSSFSDKDQTLFDKVLYNNLNTISNNKLVERLENYEREFGCSSSKFYDKWKQGDWPSGPEAHEWAILYKNLFL